MSRIVIIHEYIDIYVHCTVHAHYTAPPQKYFLPSPAFLSKCGLGKNVGHFWIINFPSHQCNLKVVVIYCCAVVKEVKTLLSFMKLRKTFNLYCFERTQFSLRSSRRRISVYFPVHKFSTAKLLIGMDIGDRLYNVWKVIFPTVSLSVDTLSILIISVLLPWVRGFLV